MTLTSREDVDRCMQNKCQGQKHSFTVSVNDLENLYSKYEHCRSVSLRDNNIPVNLLKISWGEKHENYHFQWTF